MLWSSATIITWVCIRRCKVWKLSLHFKHLDFWWQRIATLRQFSIRWNLHKVENSTNIFLRVEFHMSISVVCKISNVCKINNSNLKLDDVCLNFLVFWLAGSCLAKNYAHKSRASSTTIFPPNMRRRYTGDTSWQAEITVNGKWPLLHKSLTLLEEFIIYEK